MVERNAMAYGRNQAEKRTKPRILELIPAPMSQASGKEKQNFCAKNHCGRKCGQQSLGLDRHSTVLLVATGTAGFISREVA
jgi:hypothetical protein